MGCPASPSSRRTRESRWPPSRRSIRPCRWSPVCSSSSSSRDSLTIRPPSEVLAIHTAPKRCLERAAHADATAGRTSADLGCRALHAQGELASILFSPPLSSLFSLSLSLSLGLTHQCVECRHRFLYGVCCVSVSCV